MHLTAMDMVDTKNYIVKNFRLYGRSCFFVFVVIIVILLLLLLHNTNKNPKNKKTCIVKATADV